jgi:hypothetical protein
MTRISIVSFGCWVAVCLQSPALGAIITVPHVVVPVGTAFADIPVMISGGEEVTDMSAIVASGQGGTLNNRPPAPFIIESDADSGAPIFDYTGSIWENLTDAPAGFILFDGGAPAPEQVVDENVVAIEDDEFTTADGILFTFRVDTSGMTPGQTAELALAVADFRGRPVQTTLTRSGVDVPINFQAGSISIEPAAAIPESSTLLLLSFAAVAVGGWRYRRYRRAA